MCVGWPGWAWEDVSSTAFGHENFSQQMACGSEDWLPPSRSPPFSTFLLSFLSPFHPFFFLPSFSRSLLLFCSCLLLPSILLFFLSFSPSLHKWVPTLGQKHLKVISILLWKRQCCLAAEIAVGRNNKWVNKSIDEIISEHSKCSKMARKTERGLSRQGEIREVAQKRHCLSEISMMR